MPSTYTSLLRLEDQANGENDTTWGNIADSNFLMVEHAIAGRAAVTHDDTANYTLTTANNSADEARRMILNIGGALSAARNTVCPTSSKVYVAKNATTGGFATTLKTTAGTGISIPNGKTTLLFCDGTNVVSAIDYLPALQVGGTFTFTPANASATLSPTGTGTVTINPATAGAMNNMVIGGSTPLAGTFTVLVGNTYVQAGTRNQFTSSDRISVTGATTIFSIATGGSSVGRSGALMLVNGHDTSTTTNTFLDLVLYQSGQTPVVVSQSTTGASARTYSASGGNLQLAMASGTYNVSSSWIEQAN